jgi:LysR family transcriptional regulator, nitrogen assimilation regulatory protein
VSQGTLRMYPILAPRIVRHILCVSHPRRPLSAAADALVSIIAEELREVSAAADLHQPLTAAAAATSGS